MKVRVVDEAALTSLRPHDLHLYLTAHGWQRAVPEGTRPDLWQLPTEQGAYEVLAPASQRSPDYADRAAELLRTLSIAEDRSEADILRDLAAASFDVQYVRRLTRGRPGTARLHDAVRAFGAVEQLLRAAAWSLDGDHLVLPGGRRAHIEGLVRSALAGPALPGSFVLSVWVPVPPVQTFEEAGMLFDPGADDDEPALPYPRRATLQLHRAVTSANSIARGALADGQGVDAFVGATPDGVSANLCESLVALYGDDDVPFEWRFAWAADRPVSTASTPVLFDTNLRPVLREAARLLRQRAISGRVRLRGFSETLRRERRRGGGNVSLVTQIPGETASRVVWVKLPEADYERMTDAHRDRWLIEIEGALERRGNQVYVIDITELTLRPPDT